MSEEIVRNVNKSRTVGWANLPVAHLCNYLILWDFDSLKNQYKVHKVFFYFEFYIY